MKTKDTFLLAIVALTAMAFFGAAQDKPPVRGQSKASQTIQKTNNLGQKVAPNYPVLGYLEKQDRVIEIKSGPKGPLYTVRTMDGKTILENATADKLRAEAPELHKFIKTSVAGGASGGTMDARLGIR